MVTDADPLTGHDSKNARLGVKEKRQMRKKWLFCQASQKKQENANKNTEQVLRKRTIDKRTQCYL